MAGNAPRPSGRPTIAYLAPSPTRPSAAGAGRDPDPDRHGQRLVRPRRPVHGELDDGRRARGADARASACWWPSTRPRCGPSWPPTRRETLERDRPGPDRDQPGRRRRARRPATAPPPLDHAPATPASASWPMPCASASPGPLYLGGRQRGGAGPGRRASRTPTSCGASRPTAIAARIAGVRARRRAADALRPAHPPHRPRRASARRARPRPSSSRARRSPADRAAEYAGFDSVGQARMNAIAADGEGWVAPGLWAGIRAVRGGAGTALVGSLRAGRRAARRVPRGRGRSRHRLRLPAPGGDRAGRPRVWPLLIGGRGRRVIRLARLRGPPGPRRRAGRALRHAALRRSTARASRPRRGPSRTWPAPT